MDFDEDKIKFFSNEVDVDASFIKNLEIGTLVAALMNYITILIIMILPRKSKLQHTLISYQNAKNGLLSLKWRDTTAPKSVKS